VFDEHNDQNYKKDIVPIYNLAFFYKKWGRFNDSINKQSAINSVIAIKQTIKIQIVILPNSTIKILITGFAGFMV